MSDVDLNRTYTQSEFLEESLKSYHLGMVHGREDTLESLCYKPVMNHTGLYVSTLVMLCIVGAVALICMEFLR